MATLTFRSSRPRWKARRPHFKNLLAALLFCALPVSHVDADVCSAPTFDLAQKFNVGGESSHVAVGDLNGDNRPDLIVANGGGAFVMRSEVGTVAVMLANADGTFQAPVKYMVGTNPVFVAIGDFNGDGKSDLTVANHGAYTGQTSPGSSIAVLLGNGDGTFREAARFAAGVAPMSIALGDFNADEKIDLAVASYLGSVALLLNHGDGTFENPVHLRAVSNPQSVIASDLNRDGKLDLAAGHAEGVSVLLGNGDGSFRAAVSYAARARWAALAATDLNDDGKPDLVAAGSSDVNGGGFFGTVAVMFGRGDGTFQNAIYHPAGTFPTSAAVADFNGDGKIDLAVGNGASVGLLAVLMGNGDGTFRMTSLPIRAVNVAVRDFNRDGKPDLTSADYGGNVSVRLNSGASVSSAPAFGQIGEFLAAGYGGSVAVGDFNGDGKPDLATDDGDPSGYISVMLGNGDGTFQTAAKYKAGSRSRHVAAGDFNGDGRQDLAAAGFASRVSVLLGNGNGTFQAAVKSGAGASPDGIVVGDFNGDGKLDLTQANYQSGTVALLLGNGDGTFQAAVNYGAVESPSRVAAADFDGDGRLDVAVANGRGDGTNRVGFSVLLGRSDDTLGPAVAHITGGGASSLAAGDFNRDGKPDLALLNLGKFDPGSGTITNSSVSVLLGGGDGNFEAAVEHDVVSGRYVPSGAVLAVGNLNSDDELDLIVVGWGWSGSDQISVLAGNGDGTFRPAINYPGHRIGSVALADFNRDGRLDFVTVYSDDVAGTRATVWLNASCSAGPELAIAPGGSTFTVSWPFPSEGYFLESSTSLKSEHWSLIDALPAHRNGRWELITPVTQGQGFYRLRKR